MSIRRVGDVSPFGGVHPYARVINMSPKGRLIAVAVAVCLTTACERASRFSVVGVDLPPAGVAPNDPISVRFNAPIGEVPPDGALRILHEGRRLPTRVTVTNDVLRIHPADADGWPAGRSLQLEIPVVTLGRPLHAKDGSALEHAFSAPVVVHDVWSPRDGALTVATADIPFRDVTSQTILRLVFDAPLDPASLDGGIEIRDASGRPVPGARIEPVGTRGVAISPFVYIESGPSETYTIAATSRLRALDGRRLAKAHTWKFTTTDSRPSGEFDTSFAAKDLENPSLAPESDGLRPTATATVHEVPRALDDADARSSVPFGTQPSRIQALLPLPPEPMRVEAVTFKLASPFPRTIRIPALSVHVGLSRVGLLTDDCDRNLRGGRPRAPRSVTLVPDADGIVTVPLDAPVALDPSDGPDAAPGLIVEISNESGTEGPGAMLAGTIALHGADSGRWLESVPGTSGGDLGGFAPRLIVTGIKHPAIVLKPFTAPIENPIWIDRPGATSATGRPGVDWRVEWREIRPGSRGPVSGSWESSVSTLAGARTIQARIVFPVHEGVSTTGTPIIGKLTAPWKARTEENRERRGNR